MKLLKVYEKFPITLIKGQGSYVWDHTGEKYLDLYGGHGVVSIGHSHPSYIEAIVNQVNELGFYSNKIENLLQCELASQLGKVSKYPDYNLFMCNSGAEAVENALKLAAWHTGKQHIVSCKGGFHGRTSLAIQVSDAKEYCSPVNGGASVSFVDWNDTSALNSAITSKTAAFIIEGIQGVGGVNVPSAEFLQSAANLCKEQGALLILDEIQSGLGRSGTFFAHQQFDVKADLITLGKGLGNGFPVAAVMVNPKVEVAIGQLGTTFGGNQLACAAAVSVLSTLDSEGLIKKAKNFGEKLQSELASISQVSNVRGLGLMIGFSCGTITKKVKSHLLQKSKILTGSSNQGQTIRLLPPLNISENALEYFIQSLKLAIKECS